MHIKPSTIGLRYSCDLVIEIQLSLNKIIISPVQKRNDFGIVLVFFKFTKCFWFSKFFVLIYNHRSVICTY